MEIKGLKLPYLKFLALAIFVLFSGTHALSRVTWFFGLYSFGKALVLSSVYLAILTFCLTAIWTTANHKRLWYRAIFGLPLCISAFVGASYESITGAIVNFNSVATLINNMEFLDEAYSTYISDLSLPIFSSVAGYIGVLLPHVFINWPLQIFGSRFKKTFYHSLFSFGFPLSPYPLLFFIMMLYHGNGFEGVPMQYKVSVPWMMYYVNQALSPEILRRPPELTQLEGDKADKDIVIIMDESIRADFLDINMDRQTTPSLLAAEDKYSNFGITSAASNCSRASNLTVRFLISPDSVKESYYHNPSIWSFAKLAGYQSIYIDAQSDYGQPTNSFDKEEQKEVDKYILPSGKTSREKDMLALKSLLGFLNDSIPQFIFLLKEGIHFPYDEKYPASEEVFKPSQKTANMSSEEKRQAKVNAYKNAIRYTLNPFFEELFRDSISQPFVLYYTADHGQNLLDDGLEVTHCRYENVIVEEGMVPFFAYSNIDAEKKRFKEVAHKKLNQLSQFSLAPSLLAHMGFSEEQIKTKYGFPIWADTLPEQKFITYGIENFFLGIGLKTHITWFSFPSASAQTP